MRVESDSVNWIIVRGQKRKSYFALFVDGVPSWSVRSLQAERFVTKDAALWMLNKIRKVIAE